MDDILWLNLALSDVLSRNQPGVTLAPLGGGFFMGKNKMAAIYIKVRYDFSKNEARNKCNTTFSCDFDRAIHLLYYFHDSRSSSRLKSQFQGQLNKISIFNK